MDGSRSIGRKIGFAAVFADITRKGTLPEEPFIHTAEITLVGLVADSDTITIVLESST